MSGEMWAELGLKNTKTNTLINYQTEILDIFDSVDMCSLPL
jgi:hypothetical protein